MSAPKNKVKQQKMAKKRQRKETARLKRLQRGERGIVQWESPGAKFAF